MQRSYGNSYTGRAIEGSRTPDTSPLARYSAHQTTRRRILSQHQSARPTVARDEIEPGTAERPSSERSLDRHPPLVTPSRTASQGTVIQRDLVDDFTGAVTDAATGMSNKVSDVASDAVDAVSDVASDAADLASGLIDSVIGELRKAFDAIVGQITGVWNTVKSGVTSAVEGAIRQATGFLAGIGGFFGAMGTALVSLDVDALRAAWAGITGAASAALAAVQGIVAQVTSTIDSLWSGLKGLAEGLIGGLREQAEGLIGRLPGPVQGAARSLWKTIEEKLAGTWRTIELGWTSFRESALKRVNEVVAKVEEVAASLKDSVVTTIINTVEQVQGLFAFIKQVIGNPDSLVDPIVEEIVGRLQGLPEKAQGDAQSKVQEQAAGGPGAAAGGPSAATAAPVAAQATPTVAVQRVVQRDAAPVAQPRSTLDVGDVVVGCWDFITGKLAAIWANLWATVREMVVGVLDPRAIWSGLKEDWAHMTKDLSTRVSRFESIRTDSWDGFWEDLRRCLSNLADFPLIIWRTANAMLGRLSVYIGLAIILGGAVAGAIAGATGGAVFGSVFPGAGTAGGGVAGTLAGAWAGAQAGYALAETVGLALLVSFVAGEQVSVVKAINDLLWVPQSEEEQNEDFNQTTDSIIAVATAALLMLIAFIGVALAKRVWAFVKGLPGRFRPRPKPTPEAPEGAPRERPSEVKPAEDLGMEGGKKVLAEEPTADGKHKIKITEDGTCLYCSDCGRLTKEYSLELTDPANAAVLAKLDAAELMSNPKLKARRMAEIEAELQQIRNKNPNPIDPKAARDARLQLLARDPAHGGKVTPKSLREAECAVSLEEGNKIPGPVQRDPSGAADFFDANGQAWDHKGPNSHETPDKGGFDLKVDAKKVDDSLAINENVILDTNLMTPADVASLKAEGVTRGWGARVIFFP